jgi:hypothetical protein
MTEPPVEGPGLQVIATLVLLVFISSLSRFIGGSGVVAAITEKIVDSRLAPI